MIERRSIEGARLLQAETEREKTVTTPCSEDATLEEEVSWKHLPRKKQLFLLALCRLSTPLSNACLLPYIYYLVESILSDPDHPSAPQHISRLTGLLVAAYPMGQMSTSMVWGRLSDRYGRRPSILWGLSVSVVANLAFGFSRSIGMLLFWRILAGMANGILGVMRTSTAEIVKERKYLARAFLALPLVFNLGRVAALVIGGCLADPVKNLPWLFGPLGILNFNRGPGGVGWALRYPYALPALFNGAVLAICLLLAIFWLEESLPSKAGSSDVGLFVGKAISRLISRIIGRRSSSGYRPVQCHSSVNDEPSAHSTSERSPPISPRHLSSRAELRNIWTRPLLKMILSFGLLPLHNATFLHIFPVFLSLPPSPNVSFDMLHFTGGLGLSSPTLGLYLGTLGICGILLQLFIFPRLQKHIGNLGILRVASLFFPIAYLLAPYLALISNYNSVKWLAMAAVLLIQVMGRTMAMPSSIVLLTEAAPRRSVLGTVHGAGSTISALSSALGPVIGGVLLAKGIEIGVIGLVWWGWLLLVALITLGWNFVMIKVESSEDAKVEVQLE